MKRHNQGLVLVFWRLLALLDAALGPKGSALKGCQFENSSEYGAVFGLYSRANRNSYLFWLHTGSINVTNHVLEAE
jgi:hypothetical protein